MKHSGRIQKQVKCRGGVLMRECSSFHPSGKLGSLTLCRFVIPPPHPPRCSSGFDRHRQDWVDNSCPDEVPSPWTRRKNPARRRRCLTLCNTSSFFIIPRQRTSCATSPTPRTSTPSPPRWAPKPQPGAEKPRPTETRPPPPRRPPASPPKVKHADRM